MPEPLAKLKRLCGRYRGAFLPSTVIALGLLAALPAWLAAPVPVGAVPADPTRGAGVLVPVRDIAIGGGGIHCITQQQPAV